MLVLLVLIASKIQNSLDISGIRIVKSTTLPSRKRGPDGAKYKPAALELDEVAHELPDYAMELSHGGQHWSEARVRFDSRFIIPAVWIGKNIPAIMDDGQWITVLGQHKSSRHRPPRLPNTM